MTKRLMSAMSIVAAMGLTSGTGATGKRERLMATDAPSQGLRLTKGREYLKLPPRPPVPSASETIFRGGSTQKD